MRRCGDAAGAADAASVLQQTVCPGGIRQYVPVGKAGTAGTVFTESIHCSASDFYMHLLYCLYGKEKRRDVRDTNQESFKNI